VATRRACRARPKGSTSKSEETNVAWIDLVRPHEARGALRDLYDAAVRRAGRVFQILQLQSPNPRVLEASLELYKHAMHGASPLSRRQREMLAVVVSRANDCHY